MKAILAILFAALPLSLWAQTCDILKAWGGGMFMTLHPGIPHVISWDFTDCFGIQNYTIYVTQPRPCPSCLQRSLHTKTPLSILARNLTTGASTTAPGFNAPMGTVSRCKVELVLMLDASAKKPLAVEIGSYGALGPAW